LVRIYLNGLVIADTAEFRILYPKVRFNEFCRREKAEDGGIALVEIPAFLCTRRSSLANKPAPTAAAPPVRRPLFIKERRFTGRLVLLTGFSIVVLPVLPLSDDGFPDKSTRRSH
jgi:hypothetical protein